MFSLAAGVVSSVVVSPSSASFSSSLMTNDRPRSAGRSEKTTLPAESQILMRRRLLVVSRSNRALMTAAAAAVGAVMADAVSTSSTSPRTMVSTLSTASSTAVAVTWPATVSATARARPSTRTAAIATTVPRGPGTRRVAQAGTGRLCDGRCGIVRGILGPSSADHVTLVE